MYLKKHYYWYFIDFFNKNVGKIAIVVQIRLISVMFVLNRRLEMKSLGVSVKMVTMKLFRKEDLDVWNVTLNVRNARIYQEIVWNVLISIPEIKTIVAVKLDISNLEIMLFVEVLFSIYFLLFFTYFLVLECGDQC